MKRKKFLKKTMALCLSALMSANIFCVSAFAEDAENTDQGFYVLMNIPYDNFYKAEIKNDVMVDNVTSATLQKTRNSGLAAGSFHVDSKGSDITGITYPVKVTNVDYLKNFKEVTDEDSVTITTTNRGNTSEITYTGKDSLFESDKYSYYLLGNDSLPENYKELTFDNEGNPVFSKIKGKTTTEITNANIEISNNSRYGDYQVKVDLEGLPFTRDNTVYGVVVKTGQTATAMVCVI